MSRAAGCGEFRSRLVVGGCAGLGGTPGYEEDGGDGCGGDGLHAVVSTVIGAVSELVGKEVRIRVVSWWIHLCEGAAGRSNHFGLVQF